MRYRAQYVGPWRGGLRALERKILKFRAMQMMLIIFYAEELKNKVVQDVRATNKYLKIGHIEQYSFKKGIKNEVKIAFSGLVSHGVLTDVESTEIRSLIDFRNMISHELHSLTADLSNETIAREHVQFNRVHRSYDYEAVERLRHYRGLISRRFQEHRFTMSINFDTFVFRASERTFLAEIKRLSGQIDRLYAERKQEMTTLNAEISLDGTGLIDERHPQSPLNMYDNGQLTPHGVEICYRLFDLGRSNIAVAYLMGLSLAATRKRHKMWQAAGETNRLRVDLESLPKRKFYREHDD